MTLPMKKLFFAFTILSFWTYSSSAQNDLTLYNMNSIGQSIQVNPSLMPANNFYIGLPIISSVDFFYTNSAFTYRDFHKVRSDDSVFIDVENAMSKLKDNNYLSLQFRTDLFSFGFKFKNNYFSANVTERLNFTFAFPKELLMLIDKGNGQYLGQTLDFSKTGYDASHFREYGLGWAKELNKKLTLGVRLKYLYGMENFSSTIGDLSLRTDANDYALEFNTTIINHTSSPINDKDGYDQYKNNGWGSYLTKMKNKGFAGDLSGTYKLNDRWTFNASVIDLGFITWKDHVKNFVTNAGKYYFDGVDIGSFINDTSSNVQGVLDSLGNSYKPKENNDSYTTTLPLKIYLNSNFILNEKSFLSGMIHSTFFKKNIIPSVTLGYNLKVGNHLSLAANYSYINHHFDNFGLGISTNVGPVQFYATSDNIIGTIDPLSGHTAHIHFGLNLIFGRPLRDRDKDKVADKYDRCPDVPGLISLKGCPDKDNDSIPDIDDKCPDVLGLAKFAGCPDSDNDGIIDSEDRCPNDSGLFAFKGCPDTDGDSIPDLEDSCVSEKGLAEFHGCPDSDGDSIIDKLDECPFSKGPASNKGCPIIEKVEIKAPEPIVNIPTKEEQEIINKVFSNLEFETGKSIIRSTSYSSLNELVDLLRKKINYKLVIDGHTDNVGSATSNLRLSQNRADAVKMYITERGIDGARITAKGFGLTKPVAQNTTAEGRQRNRRVEFTIQ